jgi:hypothetical protein
MMIETSSGAPGADPPRGEWDANPPIIRRRPSRQQPADRGAIIDGNRR